MSSEELKSVIHILGDIKDCLRSDRPADDFITKWEEHNAETPGVRFAVRTVYADEIEKAELILKKELARKKKELPKEPSRNDNDNVEPKSIFDVLKSTPDVEQCILTLNNLKERTKFYPVILSEYTEDYIEDLTKIEIAVFDKLISLLKCLE